MSRRSIRKELEQGNISTHCKGYTGECLAAGYLEDQGNSILMRNFRARRGKIDIVAQFGDTLALVEVKC